MLLKTLFDLLEVLPPQLLLSLLVVLAIPNHMLLGTAYLILLERKIASWVQDRIGPNRVGPKGALQPIADGIKFLFKEDFTPARVEVVLFYLAPLLAIVPALLGWAIIPWGGFIQIGEINLNIFGNTFHIAAQTLNVCALPIPIGVIYILAVGSLAVYGVVVAGYASNNKFSFLGGLRATAQMLSYEIPLGLCVLIVLLMVGSSRADYIVASQTLGQPWHLFQMPLLAIIFFTCNLAETNRAPFDLAEAEQELVGGYHTEYSSMRFALFFLGEYLHMITAAGFFSLMFLGGWSISPLGLWPDLPYVASGSLLTVALIAGMKFGVFVVKITAIISLMMLIRWTLPRFRFDQLMRLAWRSLIPVTMALLVIAGAVVYLKTNHWALLAGNIAVLLFVVVFGSKLPQGPNVNRRVALEGSRFSGI
jgi:NADH-quinone oxidoreductase subunit H